MDPEECDLGRRLGQHRKRQQDHQYRRLEQVREFGGGMFEVGAAVPDIGLGNEGGLRRDPA